VDGRQKHSRPGDSVPLDAKAIGRRIAATRRRRGWTQRQLAERVGVRENTVALYEGGWRVPSRDALIGLGLAMRRKIDWLLFGGEKNSRRWLHVEDGRGMQDAARMPAPPVLRFVKGK
jgi:transcriptional regulator with XRE-family HTH domain